MKKIFVLLFSLLLALTACTQTPVQSTQPLDDPEPELQPEEGVAAHASITEGSDVFFRYLLYTPAQVEEHMPLIVYLHGASSQGDELDMLYEGDDLPALYRDGLVSDVPSYILMPQLGSAYRDWLSVREQVISLIESVVQMLSIDSDRVSLTGFSMGGTGTWRIACQSPQTFSCIAPLSGSIQNTEENLSALEHLKIWAFVGSEDSRIDPQYSIDYINAYNQRGGDARLTVWEGAAHAEVPLLTYGDRELDLLQWLCANTRATEEDEDDSSHMYENSDFIETEQPELDEETKALIAQYKRDPSEQNYILLRAAVIRNYDAVIVRKEAKLAELRTETAGKPGGDDIVAEMQEIVQEMYQTYWNRINSSMLRFTDPRILSWNIESASQYSYIPVMGAGESIEIKRTPVTNAEYAEYLLQTGAKVPSNWVNGSYPAGEDEFPVNQISYYDAQSYCAWLTGQDGVNTYRLPNESEWELAAGHMPKDAAFNCGIRDQRTPVEEYSGVTRGAHGAVDFWGNVWEWTSTVRSVEEGILQLGVKGGSWKSERTDCRTEYRKEARNADLSYDDVGFRVIRVLSGKEPEQKVELTTLSAPKVTAASPSPNTIVLSWEPVEGATAYQLFDYSPDTGLIQMLQVAEGTSLTLSGLRSGAAYGFIVQPISYREIADNVSSEYSITIVCS